MNQHKQVAMILYLNNQDEFYKNYHEDFIMFINWLCTPEDLAWEDTVPTDVLPDICGACCWSFGRTIGGRLREQCPFCPKDLMWTRQCVRYYYPPVLTTIFQAVPEVLNAYAANAVSTIYYWRSTRRVGYE